jgi:ankyrin repeat protein
VADVNGRDEIDGLTALHKASMYGQPRAAAMLIEAGADTTVKDERGRDALTLAALNGESGAVRALYRRLSRLPSVSAGASGGRVGASRPYPNRWTARHASAASVGLALCSAAQLTGCSAPP